MSTRPIGPGTCNLSVNVRKHVRATLGQMAFRCGDVSLGALVRRILGLAPVMAQVATKAAAADTEAARLLRTASADGIGPDDAPAILRAIALIERSAEDDRQLSFTFASALERERAA